jgi:hypothetical protein
LTFVGGHETSNSLAHGADSHRAIIEEQSKRGGQEGIGYIVKAVIDDGLKDNHRPTMRELMNVVVGVGAVCPPLSLLLAVFGHF